MAAERGVSAPAKAWRRFGRAIAAAWLVALLALSGTPAPAATFSEIHSAQQTLSSLGYDVGTPDGSMGPRTRAALRSFQTQYGLKRTGRLDAATLAELTARVLPANPPAPEPAAAPLPASGGESNGGAIFMIVVAAGFLIWLFLKSSSSKNYSEPVQSQPAWQRERPRTPTGAVKVSVTETAQRNRTEAPQPAAAGVVVTVKTVSFQRTLPEADSAEKIPAAPPVPLVVAPQTPTGAVLVSYNANNVEPLTAALSHSRGSNDGQAQATGAQCWVPAGQAVTVGGQIIPGGMIYVGRKLVRQDGYSSENCLIDPSLNVGQQSNDSGVDVPYWPSYSLLQPPARLSYLKWLAGGKKEPSIYIGYVFLYLYGLERRLMLDNPGGTEALALTTEVERLLWLYEDNHSFRRYATGLLSAAAVKHHLPVAWPELSLRKMTWQLPLDLLVCLGRAVANGEPLNALKMLSWYNSHPDKRLPALAGRCPDEFLALFTARFDAKYPGGFKLDPPKRQLGASYRAASSSFSVEFDVGDGAVPDVSGLIVPLNALDPIIDACAAELSTYARMIGKDRSKRNLVAAAAALPDHLLGTSSGKPLFELKDWVEKRVKDDMGAISIQDLLTRIGGEKPSAGKIPRADMLLIANALARCDFGIEPDARVDYPSPAVETDVVVFRAAGGATLEALTPAFLGALIHIDIGVLVAGSDGAIVLSELHAIGTAIAKNPNLTTLEKKRLSARIAFLSKHPPSSRLLSKFKGRPDQDREALSRLALSVAAADGVMAVEELRLLEKVYKTLDLPAARLYSDIQALNTGDELLPTVAQPDKITSIPIPPRPLTGAKRTAALDARRLARTRADTAVVSSILGEIFKDEEPVTTNIQLIVATLPAEMTKPMPASGFIGLDPRYLPLMIQVAERGSISRGDFEVLADSHNLLCDGAIEAINDWAFDRFDNALLDDGNEIVVNKSVLSLAQGGTA